MTEEQTIEVLASLRSINSALSAIALMLVKQANPLLVGDPSKNGGVQIVPADMNPLPGSVTYVGRA